ncbi:PREDICTED: uncharacterized transmembrane protein DDB_G0289901-like [Rhagoletis zephyria]|uniref:uncharacterized transmembrane protein DDB_G0289901-like n=1 Tax=Rhagoletis zephyria TaxID=28612 RepID=UPI00081179E5|nr:PREDICTED: uncharacterized transmembrane protein DDB_G0289901-like [Rhagoletis zephyria]
MRLFTILFCIITTSWANPILKLFHEKSKEITLEAKACCGQGGAIIHGSIGVAQVPATSIHTNLGGFSATGNLYNTQAHSSGVHSGHLVHAAGGNSASSYNHFETNERPILNYGSGQAQVHNVAVAGASGGAATLAAPASITHTLWENTGNPNLAIMQGGGASFGAAHGQSASGWNVNGGHNNYNAYAPSSYGGGETFGNSAAAAAAATSAASSWNQQNGGHQNTGNGAFSHSSSSSWSSSHSGTAK